MQLQQRRRVRHRARQRAHLVERAGEGDHAVARHAPVGRLEPHQVGERRRLADRAAGVGAQRAEHLARRHRRRRAARGAARRARQVPRVVRGAEGAPSVDEPIANSSMFSLPRMGSPACLSRLTTVPS